MPLFGKLATLTVLLTVSLAAPADADGINYSTARLDRRLPAVRTTAPLVIDGALDDLPWRDAPVATNFIQNDPREGEPASEQTEVRVLYDDANIYFGVLAHDREPHRIIVNDLRKDFFPESGDSFEIVLDTFRDERNGYLFATNAAGAKRDAQMVNEGREINPNWDGVWSVRTRITEAGWSAEIVIPFRTLKFSNTDPQTWGINFQRRVRRRNEESYWSPLPRIYDLPRVSLAGTLEGLRGLRPGRNIRLKPYALTSAGKVASEAVERDVDLGFDVKYGVTTGLTWDFTVHTDFSQVEADEQQVNLTRFSLFFPEKRDFFLENSGIFHFGPGGDRPGMAGGPGPGGGPGGRQTGAQNEMILFFSRRIGLSDDGGAIPILAGTRLTGRAGPYTIGVLNIQQNKSRGVPATNFTALRLRRDVLANSDIGLMLLNKEQTGPHYNRVAGADANFRFFDNLNLNLFTAKTFAPLVAVGRGGEDVTVRAGGFYRGRVWDVRGAYSAIGERFNDEMGFVPRLGINRATGFIGRRFRPKRTSGWLREMGPHWEMNRITRRTGRGGLDSRYDDFHWPFNFQNGGFMEIGLNENTEVLLEPFTINSRRNIVIPAGRYDFGEHFVIFRTDSSAPMVFNGRYAAGSFYDGYKHTYQLGGTARVNEQLNISANVSHNNIALRSGAYTTNLVTARVNYSFSTKMFLNALLQYNTDARQWSSNVRFNVIHRPLSDFFLVYNERRDSRSGDLINRALIAKMTYMIAF